MIVPPGGKRNGKVSGRRSGVGVGPVTPMRAYGRMKAVQKRPTHGAQDIAARKCERRSSAKRTPRDIVPRCGSGNWKRKTSTRARTRKRSFRLNRFQKNRLASEAKNGCVHDYLRCRRPSGSQWHV